MKQLLNTLYITSPDVYLSLDGENIVVLHGEETIGRVPLHNLQGIVTFGYKGASPALMGACAERDIGLCFLTPHGRFLARIEGPVKGNVLLRMEQYSQSKDETKALKIAQNFLTGKIYNSRWQLERVKRDHPMRVNISNLDQAISEIKKALQDVEVAKDIQSLMGTEGNAAKAYFSVFDELILKNKDEFHFDGRSRRPPLDPVNAMLSFTYTLLGNEISGALESVGLDPAVGYLHALRPGRKSLSLDLLEELRSPLADRFVLSCINLGLVKSSDFERKENGAYYLSDEARRKFLSEWQKRKEDTIMHPYLKEKISWGLVPYAQAMLLARYLRGDIDEYPPFLWK